jgi:hypothetical protein
MPNEWQLIIELKGEHLFNVIPEFKKMGNYLSLFLKIITK